MKEFKPSGCPGSNNSIIGTSLQGYTQPLTYDQLVKLFGEPNHEGDGCKVSTEWVLSDGETTISLYDYKETNLYNSSYPSVEEFRKQAYEWHIGAFYKGDAEAFADYLNSRIGERK